MEQDLSQLTKDELIALVASLRKEVASSQRSVEILGALQAGGVDNWVGYDLAMDTVRG